MKTNRKTRARGSALIEFLLSSLFWVPLLLGTIFVGINVTRAISASQVCRDAGHMYAYGIDFSQPQNQNLLARLAAGFSLTSTGDGVVIFSNIRMVSAADCLAAGLAADTSQCQNLNQTVFTQRIVVGNSSLRASDFGTPPASYIGANGFISSAHYLHDAGTRANGFSAVLPLLPGQYTYLTEVFFAAPDLDWQGF